MMDMGSLICSYQAHEAEKTQDMKQRVLINSVICIICLALALVMKSTIGVVLDIVFLVMSLRPILRQDQLKDTLELWTNGYILKTGSGKVYHVSYAHAIMPTVMKFGDTYIVRIWDAEKHNHVFKVENAGKAQEICEKIEEAAQNAGATLI